MLGNDQLELAFGPVWNSELFSNYWLEKRLPLEPDWLEDLSEIERVSERLVAIWKDQSERVEKYGKEATLEEKFIQPVLEQLGWKFFYQPTVQGREPDYALFLNQADLDSALESGHNSPEFWSDACLVADAKAWHVSLDKPNRVHGRKEYPPEQMEWYLQRAGLQWGILTNGRLWRLIPRVVPAGKPRFQTYLQVDLPKILDTLSARRARKITGEDLHDFLIFYRFFSPLAFTKTTRRSALIDRATLGTSEYALGVSEDLKERVFEALRLSISGFLQRPENGLSRDSDLEVCRESGFILLYRLLFIMYAEDRSLLPYRINSTYTTNRSLARIRDEVAGTLDRRGPTAFSDKDTSLWQDLLSLFDLVDSGNARYGVPAYNGGLFSSDQHTFLLEKALPDRSVALVVDKLSRSLDPKNEHDGLFRVDYRDLAIRQLGSVYEGLLEMHPHRSNEMLVVIRSTKSGSYQEKFHLASKPIPKGFRFSGVTVPAHEVYLENDNGERRATGSYYTPDHIVDHIVQSTLRPLCQEIETTIRRESEEIEQKIKVAGPVDAATLATQLREIQTSFDKRVLNLRVLDPAMGSGHFLVRACQYLAEEVATNPYSDDSIGEGGVEDDSTLLFWKRKVVENCLFGVDQNPFAVELAKLALWLETVSRDKPLAFLDHHLRKGNSLVGAYLYQLDSLPGTKPLLAKPFTEQLEQGQSELLQPLIELRSVTSDNAKAVKQKERLFRTFEARSKAFTAVADLWCGEFFRDEDAPLLQLETFSKLLSSIRSPRAYAPLLEPFTKWLARLESSTHPFHWELQFPEAFETFGADKNGFHAIIGNPPYEVLASKETGTDVEPLKGFAKSQSDFHAAFVGKVNLYKLFICRSLALLADGVFFGFIVPMALIGDKQALGIRDLIFRLGSFRQIDAFPQKDDPKNRVFPEAKLSTVVFSMQKSVQTDSRNKRFSSTRHPGRTFEPKSPTLTLSAEEVYEFDASNHTVVSCDQADWDLAIRLMRQPDWRRLEDFCTSYQGEVNETEDEEFLSDSARDGKLILRGAAICLYALREASQGEDKFIRVDEFFSGKSESAKAWHSKKPRIGFQRSAPQNNFRRLIAAPIPAGEFCFDTVSYIPEAESELPADVLLALLNSNLLEWYFRLGSSNSKANEYQFNNLPCPLFYANHLARESALLARLRDQMDAGEFAECEETIRNSGVLTPPFTQTTAEVLALSASRIRIIEKRRQLKNRSERSTLAPDGESIQTIINSCLFQMAGFSTVESKNLQKRMKALL
ncbi:MAG: DNA methyltransferase [Terracidiphilus sp.]